MLTYIGLILACIALYLLLKAKAPAQIFSRFDLNESQYQLVSSDLGKGHPRRKLSGFGLGAEADAIFKAKRSGQILVGEFKNRKHRGYIRRREYYQVILYLGLAREEFGTQNVMGLLAFNDTCVEIPYDHDVFQALIGLRSEVLASMKSKKALDSRPLHSRIKVQPQNRSIRFQGR